MLKVLVFDIGSGGEAVADFLRAELDTVEIKTVIDWGGGVPGFRTVRELAERVAEFLAPFVGQADLIVLGNYDVGLTIGELRRRYPGQKFVTLRAEPTRMRRAHGKMTAIMTTEMLIRHEKYQEEVDGRFLESPFWVPVRGWSRIMDDDLMTRELLRTNLERYFEMSKVSERRRRRALSLLEVKMAERSLQEVLWARKRYHALKDAICWLEKKAEKVRREKVLLLKNEGRIAELEVLGISGVEGGRER